MSQPFARAAAMFTLIAAAMGNQMKLASIGPYKSRGHGKGLPGRVYRGSRSKHQPHIGAKEQAKTSKRSAPLAMAA
jgi:hypothetical protein